MENFRSLNQQLIMKFGTGIDESDFNKLTDLEKKTCVRIFSDFLKNFDENGHDKTTFEDLLKDFPWV